MEVLFQQFARLPRIGGVKRRLQPLLGPGGAFEAHRRLMVMTAENLAAVAAPGRLELWLDRGGRDAAVARCRELGSGRVYLQRGGDLGARMEAALDSGLERSAAVVLIGSDCPYLDDHWLCLALTALKRHALVLGPAEDGGWLLMAVRGTLPRGLFDAVPWGTSAVLAATVERARAAGIEPWLLPPRGDIDRPDDFERWRRSLSRRPVSP